MRPLAEIECFVLDMDGTFYLGNQLIDGALEFIAKVRAARKKFLFLTNNSSKSSRDYREKLARLGLAIPAEMIINAGQVTADYLKQVKRDPGVYLVGTPSLRHELEHAGVRIVAQDEPVDFVVLGFDTTLTYQKLWDAHDLILKGIPYLATNPDWVCPLEEGRTMPDCGAMIALLKTSTGKEPLVIGKPNPFMIDYVAAKFGIARQKIAMVGDRLYTDIQTAINADITGILVLSGETKAEDLAAGSVKPDYVFPSIKELARAVQECESSVER